MEELTKLLNTGSTNIAKLAIFILIIGGNYANDTISCGLRQIIKDNMIVKHILGVLIVLIFIGFSQEDIVIIDKIKLSLLLYVWYIFIMRSPTAITITVICLIIILYILQEYIKDYEKEINNTKSTKGVDTKDVQFKILYLSKIRNFLFFISIILSVFGFVIFWMKNKHTYGKQFSLYYLLLGTNDKTCLQEKF